MSVSEMESTMHKFSVFDLNIQNKPTCSECSFSICFFGLRASNLGRHERYGY